MNDYDAFIAGKSTKPRQQGFEPAWVPEFLYPFQKAVVEWSIRLGRACLFEDCGLGKTVQQLVWSRNVADHTRKPVLILCPLAVAQQTVKEGARFGIAVNHCHQPEDLADGINITNYERIELFEGVIEKLGGVVLDESSILKSFTGKTRQTLTRMMHPVEYKLCCTATPSPNDYTELGQHAEFLGVCSWQQMLATWFINDTANTGDRRLKKHAEFAFWQWVAGWAACVGKPSDIGFEDGDFTLPPLNIETHTVETDETGFEDGMLFRIASTSATDIFGEMRRTMPERVAAAAEIVNESKEAWIVWCNTNDESDALKDAIPDAVEVRGSDRPEHKVAKLQAFSEGRARVIITKPSIAGYGLNWQHCHNVAFVGLSYSFEDFYQAVRRTYRFGQTKPVKAVIVQARTEENVLRTIQRKMEAHERMRAAMKIAAEAFKTHKEIKLMKTDIDAQSGDGWTVYHGDCVRVARTIESETIGLSLFSPPFADLFTYSSDAQDMGNCANMAEFMRHFGFLVDELMRVTKPGRLCAVHALDLMSTKWKHGEICLQNFTGEIIDAFRDRGWLFHCRVTIWKDPVTEMQRTKALGLLHKQLLKDSAMSRTGSAEYMLVFRKPGVNPEPINHTADEYPVELWQKDASPVWMDIQQTRVLNGELAREQNDERHICPLQLDVIERSLRLWSRKNDLVFSPFTGIGSEGFCAVKMGRRFVGSELKQSYFKLACDHLRKAAAEREDLFQQTA